MYSYSRLETFKQCPRKYAYQYIEKPDIEKLQGIEAYLGTVCHETIQQIYKDLNMSKTTSMEEMLAFYDDRWERDKPPSLRIVKDRYSEQNYKDTGREYVKNFYEANQPFNDGHTLGIEKLVHIKLTDELTLMGYIDRLVDKGNGHYEIIDYKTNKDLPTVTDLENNWQLPLYQLGLMQMFPDLKEVTCTWHFLAHNKPVSIRKTATDLDTLKANIQELVKKIEVTQDFEPKASALCDWCDYRSLCPAQKHMVQTELLPAEEFVKEDGVKLVDEYLRTEEQFNAVRGKMEELKQRIYDYGAQHNMTVLQGSGTRVRIWSKKDAIKLVSKEENPGAAAAIRAILERHGLWDRYSNVNGWDLGKAIESRMLPEPVLRELLPYIKKTLVWKLYSGK